MKCVNVFMAIISNHHYPVLVGRQGLPKGNACIHDYHDLHKRWSVEKILA